MSSLARSRLVLLQELANTNFIIIINSAVVWVYETDQLLTVNIMTELISQHPNTNTQIYLYIIRLVQLASKHVLSGSKCPKIAGGWGFAPDPTGGAYSGGEIIPPPTSNSWIRHWYQGSSFWDTVYTVSQKTSPRVLIVTWTRINIL